MANTENPIRINRRSFLTGLAGIGFLAGCSQVGVTKEGKFGPLTPTAATGSGNPLPETPTSVPPTATEIPVPTATQKPSPENTPIINNENLQRYEVYIGELDNKGRILFYPTFQDQVIVAYMFKGEDGVINLNMGLKGRVTRQPGNPQWKISYNEAYKNGPFINIAAEITNGSVMGVYKDNEIPEGFTFIAKPTGKKGSQAVAQAWIDTMKDISGSYYRNEDPIEAALKDLEDRGAKIPRD